MNALNLNRVVVVIRTIETVRLSVQIQLEAIDALVKLVISSYQDVLVMVSLQAYFTNKIVTPFIKNHMMYV